MEAKTAKALDRVALNLKRKRATRCAAHLNGASRPLLRQWPSSTSPTGKVVKQMRLVGNKSKLKNDGTHVGRSLVQYYMNYKKSGKPERLMFYKNGEWLDYPKDLVDLVKKELEVKKAAVEVELNGYHLVFDFLHMYQMDLKTGLQQPIAWIDEKGCCFFPEIFAASDEEPYGFFKPEGGKGQESYESNEIKLHLEIEINGMDESKMRECSGESNVLVKNINIDANQNCGPYYVEVEDSINKMDRGKVGEASEPKQGVGLDAYTESVYGKLELDTVQKMFLKGMISYGGTDTDIVEIYRCSSASMQARFELFQKQAEVTEKAHGDANIRYAWLALSKGELSTMMQYGLGHCELSASKYTYGVGVHLAAATCPYASARYCDVDENGSRHLVFCRVIMGNMELLRPGTGQSHPSSSEYDNGVDDILSPTYYIVWRMNMNTHIYPEFIVSFKASGDIEVNPCGIESKNPAVNAAGQGVLLQSESSTVDTGKAATVAASIPKSPISPWLPFPMLFAAIRTRVSPHAMGLIETYYEQLKLKQMSRDDFVKLLRLTAGDALLRATIAATGLKCKRPSNGQSKEAKKEG